MIVVFTICGIISFLSSVIRYVSPIIILYPLLNICIPHYPAIIPSYLPIIFTVSDFFFPQGDKKEEEKTELKQTQLVSGSIVPQKKKWRINYHLNSELRPTRLYIFLHWF